MSPLRGNVCFAAGEYNIAFTLHSFARLYAETYGGFPAEKLAERLWGDVYFHEHTRRFSKKPEGSGAQRSFVEFILQPLYKLVGAVVGECDTTLPETMAELGITLSKSELKLNVRQLVKIAGARFFGDMSSLVDMIAKHVPSPEVNAVCKVEQTYKGSAESTFAQALRKCDKDGPLAIHVSKLYASETADAFHACGRVISGTVRAGQQVRVLGEAYSLDDDEDMKVATVGHVWLPVGRYRIAVDHACAGAIVLLEDVDASIVKTATIVDVNAPADVDIFRPLSFDTTATIKLAVEPLNPSELPKLLDGLRKVNKSYPLLTTKVEESGEHVIIGKNAQPKCTQFELTCYRCRDGRDVHGCCDARFA